MGNDTDGRVVMRRCQLTHKRIAPVVTHTVESRDTPSIEDLLRRLLAEDQTELERWRQRREERQ